MFNIPEGATVWILGDVSPILKLKDGSVVWARRPEVHVSAEVFARAEPAVEGDLEFWKNNPDYG